MRRRTYLATGGMALAGVLAGCVGSDDEDDDGSNDGTGNGGSGNGDSGNGTADDDQSSSDDGDGTGNGDAAAEQVEDVVGALVAGDNVELVVEGVEHTTQLGEFQEADAGNEYVVVSLAMKNVTDDFLGVSNLLQTRIQDDEDYSYEQTIAVTDEQTFDDGQFAPGEVERGTVVFELPEDASGLELVFDFDVSVFGGVDRAHIDLESETDTHRLEQDLGVEIHDVGDAVGYGDVEVTVNEVRTEDSLGQFAQPDEGNEYVVLDVSVTNDTGEDQQVSTILQMLVKDGEGYSYQEDWMASGELDAGFDESAPIADGETRRGELVYEVEAGLSPLYWVFEFTLWTEGDKTFWQLR